MAKELVVFGIVAHEGDDVAPGTHGGFVFGEIVLHLAHYLFGLFHSADGKTACTDVRLGAVQFAFVVVHEAEEIVGDHTGEDVGGMRCFVRGDKAHHAIAVLVIVGGIAKHIGDRFGLDNRKCASILDTFSCFTQGLLPYGAQVLIAAGLSGLNPIIIIPHLFYPMLIGIALVLAILFRYPRKYS